MESLLFILTILIVYGSPILLFVVAWWIGSSIEEKHYAAIRRREALFAHVPTVPTRTPEPGREIADAHLATGCVVVSNDHFKRFLAGLRKIFGGRIRAYESLLDRARREAVLRMLESAPGADAILNVRIETSTISQTVSDRGMGAVEVLAYGTAIRYQRSGS